jgi:serine-type D-Ala-D-Ala carboxypeptidase (penicillin-binding protein 5/6)
MKRHISIYLVMMVAVVGLLFAAGPAFAKKHSDPKKVSAKKVVTKKNTGAVKNTGATKSKKAAAVPVQPYKSFIVMEATSGKILEEANSHEKRAPASMTKLMVADIVLEKLNKGELRLTDNVKVTKEASKIGGSQVYLKEDEEFTLEDMMRAILIASANDAAYAVSELVAGSNKEFVNLMNERAKALGMNDTEFASVHGLPPGKDQKEDVTSSYDMAILAKDVLKHPKVLEWTSTKTAEFRNGKFILNNHNKLLYHIPEVDGLKTGFYQSAGFNVTATAKKGELRFIVVVMGSSSAKLRDGFAAEKFKKYFADYTVLSLAKKGEQVDKDIILEDGKYRKIKGVAATDLNYPLVRGRKRDVVRTYNLPKSIKGEIREGQKLGEVVYHLDNEAVGKVDIVSPVYVPKANLFMRLVRKTGLNL